MSDDDFSAWRMNVAAIILDDSGHVLLGSPAGGGYMHFPQGGIKKKETPRDALHREIAEEVGLHSCRVLAEYAGLRYAYRSKNKKSKRWRGQQQTYFLLHCPGNLPSADCSGSAEFASVAWLAPESLSPELFVPFKREAIAKALEHFFPSGKLNSAYIQTRCTLQRYQYTPGLPPPPLSGAPLFGGGKKEALYHLAHLPALKTKKKQRFLVILVGLEGCGVKKCLRHLARLFDPLSTRYHLYPDDVSTAMPAPGELSFLVLKAGCASASSLSALEQEAAASGVKIVKAGLQLSLSKQHERLKDKKPSPPVPWSEQRQQLLDLMSATSTRQPWFLIPAEYGWYRDYLLCELLNASFE